MIINVDDNPAARYIRTRALGKAGYEVHEASTCAEALETVKLLHPDLVLLDVNLPDGNGIEVCRQIKSNRDSAGTIVLQISAQAISAPQAAAALNSGADSYLTEPVDSEVLVATVRALIRMHQAEKELEETNRALRRSNDDLEQFAYIASHELQEPLRDVSAHSQLLEMRLKDRLDSEEKLILQTIVKGAQRMSTLIRDVLAYSSEVRRTGELNPVPLQASLDLALANLAESIRESGARIEAGPLPVICGESMPLEQVFRNLIGNAIKYRRPGGPLEIQIAAEPAGPDYWIISIRDNGMGIPIQYQERIFSLFKRLHGREIPGTGIGLAVCRRIIESHGGRIWVESEELQGSKFLFTLRSAAAC